MEQLGVVDTSVVVSFLRQFKPVSNPFKKLLRQDKVIFSVITIFELRLGQKQSEAQRLDILFESVRVINLNIKIAELASKMYNKLEESGQRIGLRDTFIAATARREGLPIYTQNAEHFTRIDSLNVIELP